LYHMYVCGYNFWW